MPSETAPPSHDLMARFDMAHDRSDRPPEVRAYLENLRPQILKLQRELKLQTDEDIAGLDRRDDLDMNEVDKLVGLIEAFRKAWKENRVPVSETRRMEAERLEREVGAPWREFVACVDEYATRGTGRRFEGGMVAIRAIARAGEPELAWDLYKRAIGAWKGLRVERPDDLLARTEIWAGYARKDSKPPFDYWVLSQALDDMLPVESVRFEVVKALAENGCPGEALSKIGNIVDPKLRLDVLLLIRSNGGPPALLKPLFDLVEKADHAEAVRLWFSNGETSRAVAFASDRMASREIREVVAEYQGRLGNRVEAMKAVTHPDDDRVKMAIRGKAVVGLLEGGHFALATSAIKPWLEDAYSVHPADLAEMVVWFVRIGEWKLGKDLASNLFYPSDELYIGTSRDFSERERAQAIVRVANAFSEHGLETDRLLQTLREMESPDEDLVGSDEFFNLYVQARTESSLRAFKRGARRIVGENPAGGSSWDQAAWEKVGKDLLADRPDIAAKLTYDRPVPA